MAFEQIDAGHTLLIRRRLKASRAAVWRCWTEGPLLMQWHCPKPWSVTAAELDVRPGGGNRIVMEGPAGERNEMFGCYLEVVSQKRLTFTDALGAGFAPREGSFMTGFVELSDAPGGGTDMIWGAKHGNLATVAQHIEMGFDAGWNICVDQLDELAVAVPAMPGLTEKVRTCLGFNGNGHEAAALYVSLLPDSYIEGEFYPDADGRPLVVEFRLGGAPYMILNAGPVFKPSMAASISVLTKDQAETDRLWTTLTANGGSESMCGWLVDRFGVSWQIVPEILPRLMHQSDRAAADRARDAMLKMNKINIAALEAASTGK